MHDVFPETLSEKPAHVSSQQPAAPDFQKRSGARISPGMCSRQAATGASSITQQQAHPDLTTHLLTTGRDSGQCASLLGSMAHRSHQLPQPADSGRLQASQGVHATPQRSPKLVHSATYCPQPQLEPFGQPPAPPLQAGQPALAPAAVPAVGLGCTSMQPWASTLMQLAASGIPGLSSDCSWQPCLADPQPGVGAGTGSATEDIPVLGQPGCSTALATSAAQPAGMSQGHVRQECKSQALLGQTSLADSQPVSVAGTSAAPWIATLASCSQPADIDIARQQSVGMLLNLINSLPAVRNRHPYIAEPASQPAEQIVHCSAGQQGNEAARQQQLALQPANNEIKEGAMKLQACPSHIRTTR